MSEIHVTVTVDGKPIAPDSAKLREAEATIAELRYMLRWYAEGVDPERMLDLLRVCGIPARDLGDIYRVVDEWERGGGNTDTLERCREVFALRQRVEQLETELDEERRRRVFGPLCLV